MRGVRVTADGVRVLDVPEPAGDGPHVQVVSSGVCGSDLHLVELGPLPATLGHEFAGRLDDGTPVAIDPSRPCGTCDQCRTGAPHRCRTGSSRALGIGADGGLADRVVVPDAALVPSRRGSTSPTRASSSRSPSPCTGCAWRT